MGLAGREMLLMVVGVMCLGSVVNGNTASSAGIQTPISGYGIVGEAITVELEDSRLQEVVAFSLAELNKRATSKGPRSLMEVVSAHKQIVKGTLYHIALRVEAAGAVSSKAVETYEITALDNGGGLRMMRMQVTATQSKESLREAERAAEEARLADQAVMDAQEVISEDAVQEEIEEPMFLLDESVEAAQAKDGKEAPAASEPASTRAVGQAARPGPTPTHEAPAASELATNNEAPAASEPARAAVGKKAPKVSRLRKAAGGLASGGWRRRSEL
mmetsp:Transcript_49776/g.159017  ORF Transcript_49776/g.159017 Transcript_49776/m.159017 type:complete len:274 (-) Transcript_49776:64-885(-)